MLPPQISTVLRLRTPVKRRWRPQEKWLVQRPQQVPGRADLGTRGPRQVPARSFSSSRTPGTSFTSLLGLFHTVTTRGYLCVCLHCGLWEGSHHVLSPSFPAPGGRKVSNHVYFPQLLAEAFWTVLTWDSGAKGCCRVFKQNLYA